MTDPTDPPRLLDPASAAPAGLRDLLKAAERDVGSTAQLARLSERLGPLLAAPAPAAPGKVPSGSSAAAKLGLSALALLLAGGGAWLLSTSQSAAPPAPTSTPSPPARPDPIDPAPVAPPAAAPSEATPAPGASDPEPSAAPAAGAKPAPPAQLSEAELLEQARAALRSDPARALARANEHRRRFPGGVLVQEREVIAIKALRQLGRESEAEQRAAAFQRAFPGSAFQRKLKPSP